MEKFIILSDYSDGGILILELKRFRQGQMVNYVNISAWNIVFSFGNTKKLNFKLNELQSLDKPLFFRKDKIYTDLNAALVELEEIKREVISHTTFKKVDEKYCLKTLEKTFEEEKENIKNILKQNERTLNSFKNFSPEAELRRRGLIF